MRTETRTYTLYRITELSEEAKEKAHTECISLKRNNIMVPNITSGSSFYGVIAYNKIKVDEGMAKVL